ncbi:MAG: hypothetical protein AAB262_08845, partial [Elusimicrobiota bacterium]
MRDMPFLMVAGVLHGVLIAANPALRWGAAMVPTTPPFVAVEFVQALPPTPALAPMPAGGARRGAVHHGPGPIRREQVKKPQGRSVGKRSQTGIKTKPNVKARPVLTPERKEALAQRRLQAKLQAQAVLAAQVRAESLRQTRLESRRQAAAELAARKAAEDELRAQAVLAARLEAQRIREEQLRLVREAAAELAARRAAEAWERARQLALEKAERARLIAEERAEQARQRVEISRQLAALSNSDEALSDGVNEPAGPIAGSPRGRGKREAAVARGGGGDAAAIEGGSEPVYEIEHEKRGLRETGG